MEQMIEILQELHADVDFHTHTSLIDDKVLDSFDIIAIIAEIDNVFNISVPAEEIIPDNFNSAQALYAMVEKLKAENL